MFTGRVGKPHPAEVVFERILREHGSTHRLTGVRAPTTTGKIERFHKTLRAELLTGRRFDSLALAQQVLDAWVTDYNYRRPHQAIAMAVPAKRFHRPPPSRSRCPSPPAHHGRPDRDHPPGLGQRPDRGLLPAGLNRPAPRRPGRHRPAPPHRAPGLLRRPAHPHRPRRSTKEVVQLRAHRPHRPQPRPTTT